MGAEAVEEDVGLDDVARLARLNGQGDIAAAIEAVEEANSKQIEGMDDEDIDLPFYEEDREMAFTLGLTAGAVLEAEAREAEE